MIKAFFLDIDNTILDFDEYVKESLRSGFEKFGLPAYEPWMYDVFTRENNKLWQRIEKAELTFEELQKIRFQTIFEALGLEADGPAFEAYFRACLNESAIPVEGARELLAALKERGIVCAASNGPYAQQLNRIGIADMTKYFDYYFISGALGVSKPAAAFFEKSFAILNEGRTEEILPSECMMIGDSLTSDMAGGRGFGMKTCFYERKPGSHSFADGEAPDHVVTSLSEIPAIL